MLGTGAGNNDVKVFGMMYTNTEGIRFVFAAFPHRLEKLMVFTNPKFGIYWLIKDGKRERTVYLDKNKLVSIPNELYDERYRDLLVFFVKKAKEDAQ
jgi:hypothetical protein